MSISFSRMHRFVSRCGCMESWSSSGHQQNVLASRDTAVCVEIGTRFTDASDSWTHALSALLGESFCKPQYAVLLESVMARTARPVDAVPLIPVCMQTTTKDDAGYALSVRSYGMRASISMVGLMATRQDLRCRSSPLSLSTIQHHHWLATVNRIIS